MTSATRTWRRGGQGGTRCRPSNHAAAAGHPGRARLTAILNLERRRRNVHLRGTGRAAFRTPFEHRAGQRPDQRFPSPVAVSARWTATVALAGIGPRVQVDRPRGGAAPFPISTRRAIFRNHSTGSTFGHAWVDDLSDADGAATLTAFTASAVGRGLDPFAGERPHAPDRLRWRAARTPDPSCDDRGLRRGRGSSCAEAVGWARRCDGGTMLRLSRHAAPARPCPAAIQGTTGMRMPAIICGQMTMPGSPRRDG